MEETEHNGQLLVAILKALDRVSGMAGTLDSIKSSLNDDVKPDLRAIKQELKEKVSLSEYIEHRKEFHELTERVGKIEKSLDGKEAVKKSWKTFISNFAATWKDILLLLLILHYTFLHVILPNFGFSSFH